MMISLAFRPWQPLRAPLPDPTPISLQPICPWNDPGARVRTTASGRCRKRSDGERRKRAGSGALGIERGGEDHAVARFAADLGGAGDGCRVDTVHITAARE